METPYIVIFDGLCNFCRGVVRFILRRDKKQRFVFVPRESGTARRLMEAHPVAGGGEDALWVIKGGKPHVRSNAALEIVRALPGLWPLLYGFKILPRPLRDVFYRLLARNRYRLFGRSETPMIPDPEMRDRFLES